MQPWLEGAPKNGEKMNGHQNKSYNTMEQPLGTRTNSDQEPENILQAVLEITTNQTTPAPDILADQSTQMRNVTFHYGVGSDYLLTETGAVCEKLNYSKYCLQTDDDRKMVKQLTKEIKQLMYQSKCRKDGNVLQNCTPKIPKLRDSSQENAPSPSCLLCSVMDFYPAHIQVRWFQGQQELSGHVVATAVVPNGDWTHQLLALLETTPGTGLEQPLRGHWGTGEALGGLARQRGDLGVLGLTWRPSLGTLFSLEWGPLGTPAPQSRGSGEEGLLGPQNPRHPLVQALRGGPMGPSAAQRRGTPRTPK
uniref:Immunoglobulin C1-set domain-containing protein n=1 Tax=Cyanoderma ruficeps TaxID=181631 RepID=A0A8C3X7Q2_9PASS